MWYGKSDVRMIQKYNIQGMTCNGCKAQVEHLLSEVKGVSSVNVHLQKQEASIEMNTKLNLEKLSSVLPAKYTIEAQKQKVEPSFVVPQKSIVQQLFPLFLIFGYITIAAVLLHVNAWDTSGFMLDFMGLFYVVFSFFKLLDIRGFQRSFQMYDPLAKVLPAYGWIYPFLEVGLGLLFLMRFEVEIALIVTIVLLGTTTIGVIQVLLAKKTIQCACLGTVLKLPMTKATFIENSIMLIMAIWMLLH